MSKNPRLTEPFDKPHDKRAQGLLKSGSQHLFPINWSLASQLSWKKSLLLTSQIFGWLLNTLPADEKYPLLKIDNLTIPIQMILSQKQKNFSEFLAEFLKSRLNSQYFEEKDDPKRFFSPEITTSKNVVR